MRMAEILKEKGIDINENCSWRMKSYPAENGEPRQGRIRKEMEIYSSLDDGKSNYSVVGVKINTFDTSIEVVILDGPRPAFKNLCWALLSDRDIRRLITEYQEENSRNAPYMVEKKETKFGQNIYITYGYEMNGFMRTENKELCCNTVSGRLARFGTGGSMLIGDFVEMVKFMGFTDEMNRKALRKKAEMNYILPEYEEGLKLFSTEVSKIL